ncbi:MAG: hypothetical protein COX90_02755 [Candidatus Nealsonbacteria bacterium CG_4_10_14_0_2_um_filter_38_17]|uniref:HTH HARE-type domain-containing protein n=2 Tax=Candidatus Nealsoniibacteriota TaxID=1817911 RepID=A0A2M7UXS8_9BACT|nr:MAG: hypothetical protein COX36_04360 [Candidatus Nealsonbacteria bacterium CG23_combo_of_CG06-09_8_20_14_all_38_19]PIZ88784.1 MAG: hypothetical protein COX90_02755 [Candidatus Nealsonbacteria bacterium CG_4_10_14_0_2_um_filter_38_17]
MPKTNINYLKICKDLTKDLSQRTKEVISRRFGFETGERKTLESIGDEYGITRERVRQIERDGFSRIEPKLKNYENVLGHFEAELRTAGDLKREDLLFDQLAGGKNNNCLYFLLTVTKPFQRFSESQEFYPLWTINTNSLGLAKKVVDAFAGKFEEIKKPLSFDEIYNLYDKEMATSFDKPLNSQALLSYIEASKKIEPGYERYFGLKEWPEITPRGMKDKAYLVLKKEQKPLHFVEVARLIGCYFNQEKVYPQTVHNELIRDPRFVLVGRGLYALKEWGYEPGVVKDVIFKVLKTAGKPLTKEEVVQAVLKQRLVKENTVLLNLQGRGEFKRTPEGKYTVRKA